MLSSEKQKYFGFISEGRKHGFGRLEQGEHVYVGEFQQNSKHGYFEVFKNNKLFLQGLYKDNVLIRGVLFP